MNSFVSVFYRDVACGAAALAITLIFSAAFVETTSAAPGTHVQRSHLVALQSTHGWFGQPQPAVLVD